MILIIDVAKEDVIALSLFGSDGSEVTDILPAEHRAMLAPIVDFLAVHKVEPSSLQAVILSQYPKSFSRSRLAYTIVNTLAYALNIPTAFSSSLVGSFAEAAALVARVSPGNQLLPAYSGAPRIGGR